MYTAIKNSVRILSIVITVFVLLTLTFAIVPKVRAADILGGGYDVYDYSGGFDTYDGGYDVYDYSGGYDVYDYSGGFDSGFTDYYGGSSGWSFGGGSGFTGGWTMPTRSGGNFQQQSLTNTNVNENYCTNGSCNTNLNAPTNIVTSNPAPTYPVYQPTYPVYTQPAPIYTQPTYYPASRPITYAQPYVSLAAVPYTGLELGPVGTALYWGFLVLWCLLAAYLIVVKKIQNKIAAWFTGSSQNIFSQKVLGSPSLSAQPDHFAQKYSASNFAPKSKFGGIDPFILSQINRAR